MVSRFYYGRKHSHSVKVTCRIGDSSVVEGLAYTPSQLKDMAFKGIPISSGNVSQLPDQGVLNPTWDVPLECKRGTDVSDLWSAERSARSSVGNIYSSERSKRDYADALQKQKDAEILANAKKIVETSKT